MSLRSQDEMRPLTATDLAISSHTVQSGCGEMRVCESRHNEEMWWFSERWLSRVTPRVSKQ